MSRNTSLLLTNIALLAATFAFLWIGHEGFATVTFICLFLTGDYK